MKIWTLLPPKLAHDLAPFFINSIAKTMPQGPPVWSPLKWRNLEFPNRLGLAGGVDKCGLCNHSWPRIGVGFMELGTVTPKSQGPNPGSILMRDLQSSALWNKMGFPNQGVEKLKHRLEIVKDKKAPVFINVGKNRNTPVEKAAEDYVECIKQTYDLCDGIVINISSPNTTGLRKLQSKDHLRTFIETIQNGRPKTTDHHAKPLLIKLSPDITDDELAEILDTSLEMNIDGWVLTNTTLNRSQTPHFPKEGGVSGRPLAQMSLEKLKFTTQYLGEKKGDRLLISVGGIMSADDIRERLELGADLVEVYSALVLQGPWFFRSVAKKFQETPLTTH